MKETLCWKCAVPGTGGCSWDQAFVPVKGWTATPTRIWISYRQTSMESFMVHECPLFRTDTGIGMRKEDLTGRRKITDEQMLACMENGLNDEVIAAMFGMARKSIRYRRKLLEQQKGKDGSRGEN